MSQETEERRGASIMGSVSISVTPSATMSFGYLQSGKIKDDLMYFVSCYRDGSIDLNTKATFSRIAIILMAFYFECLSNSLFSENDDSWKAPTNSGEYGQLSKAVRKFIAKHNVVKGNDISIDYKGIQDLFHVRNKIFAHPSETIIITSNDPSRITNVSYRKFIDFPSSYTEFNETHADAFLNEMNMFLREYTNLMKSELPDWWMRNYGA